MLAAGDVVSMLDRQRKINKDGNTVLTTKINAERVACPVKEGKNSNRKNKLMGKRTAGITRVFIKSPSVQYTGLEGDDMNGEDRKFGMDYLRTLFAMPKHGDDVFLEWRGNRRVTAEGIDGLLEYGHTRVVVGAKKNRIAILGDGLEMRFLSETCIVIEGKIIQVCYLQEERE